MPTCRMELADAGSPDKLVTLILRDEPDLPIPVPIEELCERLDISAIQDLETEGFEGGLLTDTDRSAGVILVRSKFQPRRRFTIAHELGHFLMPMHVPDQAGKFLCKASDLLQLTLKEGDRRRRMEVEANRFASLILMPPPMLRKIMRGLRGPDLQHVPALARQFDVSKEAMARAYAQNHEEPVAIVVTHHGRVLRHYKNHAFPYVTSAPDKAVPAGSLYHRGPHEAGIASDFATCIADHWIDVRRGERAPTLYEQVYPQRDGFGLLLLHLERVDEDDEAEDSELKDSYRVVFGSSRRRR